MEYRTCETCGAILPNDRKHFRRTTINGKDKLTSLCKDCYIQSKINKEWKDGKLLCHLCGEYFDPSEFGYRTNRFRNNKDSRCRKCRSLLTKYRINNLDLKEALRQILQTRFLGAKERSKRLNIPFDITKDFLQYLWDKQKGLCAISNIPMTYSRNNGRTSTNVSIDLINPHLGYTKDNIQLVCMAVNQMKNDLSMEELYMFCESILNARKWHH